MGCVRHQIGETAARCRQKASEIRQRPAEAHVALPRTCPLQLTHTAASLFQPVEAGSALRTSSPRLPPHLQCAWG